MNYKKILKLFLIELVFFVILLAFLVGVKLLVGGYLEQIQNYSLNTDTEQDMINTQVAIDDLSSVVNKAYFVEILLVPFGIFLIFGLLQGFSLMSVLGIKHWKKYMFKFSIVSAILILGVILSIMLSLWLILIVFILIYLGFILFSDFSIKKSLHLAYKKAYVLLPLFLLGLVVFGFEMFILALLLGVFSAGLYSYAWFYIVPMILSLIFMILYKLLCSFVLKKY
jgi:hypothetical protein